MHDEMKRGLAVMRSLDDGQKSEAVPETSKHGNNHGAEGFRDNVVPDYAGGQGGRLSEGRSEPPLLNLVGEFVGNMSDGYAKVKMGEVRDHLDARYFAWIGGFEKDSVFH